MSIKTVFLFCLIGMLLACSEPKFIFLEGDSKKLSDYNGQWLLINYWAAWCKPCLKEIPELNALNTRSDLNVLAFNYDDLDSQYLKPQLAKFNIQYRSIMNEPAGFFRESKPVGLPATLVVNKRGQFVQWLYGAQTKESILQALADDT